MTVIVLDGATGAGKSHLLEHIRTRWSGRAAVGAKFTTRRRRASDNDWEFSFVDEIPVSAHELSYGSVGHRYAIDQEALQSTVGSGQLYCITCVDRELLALLKRKYDTRAIYVYRPMSAADVARLFEARNTTNAEDIRLREAELASIEKDYTSKVTLIDHVILNVGPVAGAVAQLDLILAQLITDRESVDRPDS